MPTDPRDLVELLTRVRYDLTALQGKLTEALTVAAALPMQPTGKATCPRCGIRVASDLRLTEHLWNVHGEAPAATATP